ncbi:hypothetical protein M8J71_15455 [Pseudarthrobacter sp. R1]|uniref:hypothetical protein n=1 Tax=Pseudarthrobacter sp. R1 TaxID=2944934 RepID=UPI00210B88C5|nr:hypothetical protein [Pseudarthrobacter sp. R1]MCQ6271874.1 hypothetical protein [Pseudarthrobacter sp. R1]
MSWDTTADSKDTAAGMEVPGATAVATAGVTPMSTTGMAADTDEGTGTTDEGAGAHVRAASSDGRCGYISEGGTTEQVEEVMAGLRHALAFGDDVTAGRGGASPGQAVLPTHRTTGLADVPHPETRTPRLERNCCGG